MNRASNALPAAAEWILTRRLPCALVASAMFGMAFWFPGTVLSMPFLLVHLLTPALFALITLGGGTTFGAQVALLATVISSLATHMSVQDGLMMLTLYGFLPILAASALRGQKGISRSARHLAIGLGAAMLGALIVGTVSNGVDAKTFVDSLLSPLFAVTSQQGLDAATVKRIHDLTVWIFPGISVLCLWLIWWGNIVLARNTAFHYGFFHGDMQPVRSLRLERGTAYLFLLLFLAGILSQGTVRYLALNASVLTTGLFAVQGLAVVHTWLWCRGIHLVTGLMYIALLIQPVMVLPFAGIGLLDIWFDFRRGMHPVDGGKK